MHRKLALCAVALVFGFMAAAPGAEAAAGDRRGSVAQRSSGAARPAAMSRPSQASRPSQVSRPASSGSRSMLVSTSRSGRSSGGRVVRGARAYGGYGGGLSCVPYARQATGMEISGNGGQWWYNAAGSYARGNRPEPGSILAMPSSGGMRAGHVAVVERVISPREITIHHANWGGPGIRRGTVMRGVSVVDVSDRNDWSVVRVQVGHDNDTFGRTYPVQGFIYNRPDTGGTMVAAARSRGVTVQEGGRFATLSELQGRYQELAAMPAGGNPLARQHLDLTRTGLSLGR